MITIQSFEFNPFSVNTYLLYDETREAVVIDCGCCQAREEAELSAFLADNNLTLKHLLCTHLHLDHIFGNDFISRTYGVQPQAHQADTQALPSPEEQAKRFGIRRSLQFPPFASFLADGQTLRFGQSELLVKATPGHSPGGLTFYNPQQGLAFTGDTIFRRNVGRTDLWGSSHEALLDSINKQILSLPDSTLLYPGHGPATTVKDERTHNPYLQ